ncbi:hypothetical protein JKA73_25970 [Myxococcus xanthus]|uniref:hypothetical protein n=1 Tax=Myxococcus xanthus TaxID=34 RepID=UPI001916FE71|nr:hypothetical protein [Myxococcus xanthus]QQR42537.1 hypothetical protein JKA73_25970 [Myxococcus xanthus]
MKSSCAWMLICAVGLSLGCGAEAPQTSDEELIPQTVAWVNDDGTLEQHTSYVTRAELQAQASAREAQRIAALEGRTASQIPSLIIDCNNSNTLWLFSGTNYTGAKLCLYRNPVSSVGLADLSRIQLPFISFPPRYWAGAVRSLSAGIDAGNLATCDLVPARCYTAPAPYVGFTAWQNIASISAVPGYPNAPNTAWLND